MFLMLWPRVHKPVVVQHGVGSLALADSARDALETGYVLCVCLCGGHPDTQKPSQSSACDQTWVIILQCTGLGFGDGRGC